MPVTVEEWAMWFEKCMLLPACGFIPSHPAYRNVSPPCDVVQRWGEKTGVHGYPFRESDGEDYHLYVEELYNRVHQRPMPERLLPLHFARGLLEESRGSQVNWVAFAVKRCFAHHKRTQFQPLPQYANVKAALPWVNPKVMPLATESDRELTEMSEVSDCGGHSEITEFSALFSDSVVPTVSSCRSL